MSDRGMKKYAPYASLIEQKGYLQRMMEEKKKISRPHISSDVAEHINEVLLTHNNRLVKAIYYENGFLIQVIGIISKIDMNTKTFLIGDTILQFVNLIGLDFN